MGFAAWVCGQTRGRARPEVGCATAVEKVLKCRCAAEVAQRVLLEESAMMDMSSWWRGDGHGDEIMAAEMGRWGRIDLDYDLGLG